MSGQCYDGAASSNCIIHSSAHRLNKMRDLIETVREMINFVEDSPKRMAYFKHLQDAEDGVLPGELNFIQNVGT